MEKSKVVIIGTGFVGMSYAYALVNQGAVEEIVLIDVDVRKAEGEAMDLNHGLAFAPRKMLIQSGSYEDVVDAGLIVITAGVSQKEGESRLDLLKRNSAIMRSIVRQVMAQGYQGILLIATNPVDILTYIAYQESGLPSSRVIGSGTSLDSARLRYEISQYIDIDVRNIHAYMMGEHGDSEFVCWSNANVGGKPFKDVVETMHQINFEDLEDIAKKVKYAAYDIIERKKATYYGIGMALVRITLAIFNNENRILPISVYNDGVYEIEKDVYIGLPAVLNRQGVHHVVKLKLDEEESEKLKASAKILKSNLTQIEGK